MWPASIYERAFDQRGGILSGKAVEIEGEALFTVGESAVSFFGEDSDGRYRVAGGSSGRFAIAGDAVESLLSSGLTVDLEMGEFAQWVRRDTR